MAELRVKSTGTIKLFESDNTSSVTIASPASLSANKTITLPDADVDLTEVNTMPLANLDIDGGTEIGAAIVDADLFIVDDGAGGTNRKVLASRIKTYAGGDVYVSSFSRDVSTATGTQAVTGVGFTPTSIEVFAAIGGTVKASWGMSDGTTDKCIYQNNNGGTDFISNQSQLIRVVTVDAGTMYSGTLDSFDADGFTISWTKTGSPTGTVAGNFIARK